MTVIAGPSGQAFHRGYEAFRDGDPQDEASREPEELRTFWLQGWDAAKEDHGTPRPKDLDQTLIG